MKTPLTSFWFQQWLTKTDLRAASSLESTSSVQTQPLFFSSQAENMPASGALQKRIQCGLLSLGEQLTYFQSHARAS